MIFFFEFETHMKTETRLFLINILNKSFVIAGWLSEKQIKSFALFDS
jgi:hypothetical protein